MSERLSASPLSDGALRLRARIAGIAYLGTIVGGIFAEAVVRGKLVVSGDAAATAASIVASSALYRSGLIADVFMLVCYVVVTGLFHELFKPVSRTTSRIAALFSLIGIAVLAAACISLLAPLILLGGAPWVQGFTPGQLQTLAYAALRLHSQGYVLSIVFFGVYCVLIGWLVFRSGFLPRVLGVLMAFAGVCYLINSMMNLLALSLPGPLSDLILLPGLIAEGALGLWLTALAIKVPGWAGREA